MSRRRDPHPASVAAQGDHFIDLATGAITPAIHPSTTFARDDRYELINPAHGYARDQNPSYLVAERMLTALEQGEESMLFSSGMAAIAALFSTVPPGSHVLAPASMYWGTFSWTQTHCARNGIGLSYYNAEDEDAIARAIKPAETRLVWVETPSNPMLNVTDIGQAAQICHAAGALLCVDSTTATPVFTQPLNHNADLIMHSATKALNGHSDVVAGALVTRERHATWEALAAERHGAGAILGSFEAWLLQRGMRTLYVRVQRAADNALHIAKFLQQHAKVLRVLYPGLGDHPGHEISKRQMRGGYGTLLSFLVAGDARQTLSVAGQLKMIVCATSLGGVETLIEHRHSVEPPQTGVPENLLRLSVGIEHIDDLIDDLDQALTIL